MAKSDRQKRKQDRKDRKAQNKDDRREDREDRLLLRTERDMVAYEHGIDPKAWIGNTIEATGNAAGQVIGGIYGGGANKLLAGQGLMPDGGYNVYNTDAQAKSKSSNMMILIVAVIAIFGFLAFGRSNKTKIKM